MATHNRVADRKRGRHRKTSARRPELGVVNWLRIGAVTVGLGAAMTAGQGVAFATSSDTTGDTVSSAERRESGQDTDSRETTRAAKDRDTDRDDTRDQQADNNTPSAEDEDADDRDADDQESDSGESADDGPAEPTAREDPSTRSDRDPYSAADEDDTDEPTTTRDESKSAADEPLSATTTDGPDGVQTTTSAQNRNLVAAAVAKPVTTQTIVADVLTWIGVGPEAVDLPAEPQPVPAVVETLWLAVRQNLYQWNNQRPTGAPVVAGQDPRTGVVSGQLGAVDYEDDPLTYVVSGAPEHGSVVIDAAGNFVYTPDAAFALSGGADSFTVTLDDMTGNPPHTYGVLGLLGLLGPATTSVTFTVTPIELHEPQIGSPPFTYTVDQATGTVTGSVNISDPDADPLTYTYVTPDAALGSFSGDAGTGGFTFDPTEEARYHAWFTDGEDTATFTVFANDGETTVAVIVSVPISAVHPDADGDLSEQDIKDLVATGDLSISEGLDGAIGTIDGAFTSTAVGDSTAAAEVLNRIAELLGASAGFVTEDDISKYQIVGTGLTGDQLVQTFYRVRTNVNGVPVLGSEIVLATDGDGRVTGVFSGYDEQLANVDTTPVDSGGAAAAAVQAVVAGEFADDPDKDAILAALAFDPELVVYALDSDVLPVLAWKVTVSSTDQEWGVLASDYFVYANGATAGTILGTGGVDGAAVGNDTGRNITVYSTKTKPKDLTRIQWGKVFGDPGRDRYVQPTLDNLTEAYDYYRYTLGHNSVDGKGLPLEVGIVDELSKLAGWFGYDHEVPNGKFGFGSGSGAALDIVAHEYTHGVIAFVVGNGDDSLRGTAESRALNEAYADIMGSLIENRSGAAQWEFGNGSPTGILRDSANPAAGYHTDYTDFDRSGDVYENSTIFSHAVAEMMDDSEFSSVTRDDWAKVMYGSMYRLSPTSKFVDARSAMISTAKSYGFTPRQIEVMQREFDDAEIKAYNYRYGAYASIDLQTGSATNIGMSSSGNRAYVLTSDGTVKIIDTSKPNPVVTDTVQLGGRPTEIAVSADGTRAFITNGDDNTVQIVEKLLGLGNTTPTVTAVNVGNNPTSVATNAAGTRAFVTNTSDGTVTIIDYAWDSAAAPAVRTVAVGSIPTDIAVSADGTRAYVSNSNSDVMSIIDYSGANPTVSPLAISWGPGSVKVSADGRKAIVYSDGGIVSIVDASGTAPIATTVYGNHYSYNSDGFVAISADGTRAFVTEHDSGLVAIIDTAMPGLNPTYGSLSDLPHSVTAMNNGRRAFTVGHDALYVIDGRTGAVYTANIPVNNYASDYQRVVVSANGDRVIAVSNEGTLTVLNATAF